MIKISKYSLTLYLIFFYLIGNEVILLFLLNKTTQKPVLSFNFFIYFLRVFISFNYEKN
jgi:hypothetical protein